MKSYFIRKKTIANQKKPAIDHSVSTNVLLLLEDSLSVNQVSKLFQHYFDTTYQLHFVVFTKEKRLIESPAYQISKASFSLFGSIKSEHINSLLKNHFKYQFNLFSKDNFYLLYISSCVASNFSVGFTTQSESINDISIKASVEELDLFFEEAKKYLLIVD